MWQSVPPPITISKRTFESRAKRSSINLVRTHFHLSCLSHTVETRLLVSTVLIPRIFCPKSIIAMFHLKSISSRSSGLISCDIQYQAEEYWMAMKRRKKAQHHSKFSTVVDLSVAT
ncbi:hypothetical protein Tco_0589279 [Tanacetum coccineum]